MGGEADRMRWQRAAVCFILLRSKVVLPPHPPHCVRHLLLEEKARVGGGAGRMRWQRAAVCFKLRLVESRSATSSASLCSAPSPRGEGSCGRRSRPDEVATLCFILLRFKGVAPPHPPHCVRHLLLEEKARVDGGAGRMRWQRAAVCFILLRSKVRTPPHPPHCVRHLLLEEKALVRRLASSLRRLSDKMHKNLPRVLSYFDLNCEI